ncbi:hypothetical protein GCM10027341_56460 [Spirosoma knui]
MTEGNTVPARFYERASLPTVGGLSDRTAQGVEGKKNPSGTPVALVASGVLVVPVVPGVQGVVGLVLVV